MTNTSSQGPGRPGMNYAFLDSSKARPKGCREGKADPLPALRRNPPQPAGPSTVHTPTETHSWAQSEFRGPGRSPERAFRNSDDLENGLEGGSGSLTCRKGHCQRRADGGSGQRSLLLGFKSQSDYTTSRFNLRVKSGNLPV